MVRLTDLPDYEREHLLSKNQPPLGPPTWTPLSKPISELRIALITTAGLHFRDDLNFEFADSTFRPIAGSEDANSLVMSHSSVNFDKTGFAEDVNLVFPIDRFRELQAAAEDRVAGGMCITVLWVLAWSHKRMRQVHLRWPAFLNRIRLMPYS